MHAKAKVEQEEARTQDAVRAPAPACSEFLSGSESGSELVIQGGFCTRTLGPVTLAGSADKGCPGRGHP